MQQPTVSFFSTCLADTVYADIAIKTVELLEYFNCRVLFNPDQTCCGQPLTNSGHHTKARKAMQQLITALLEKSSDYVVAPSGSCVLQVKEYPHFFQEDPNWLAKAETLAAKTWELTDFLVNVLEITETGAHLPGRAVYHPSCHMSRRLGVTEPPLILLANVKGLELVPFAGQDRCCGFGGTFSVKMGSLSGAMVSEKVEAMAATGAEYVIGADGGCLMNIEGRVRRTGLHMKVLHIAQVLMHR